MHYSRFLSANQQDKNIQILIFCRRDEMQLRSKNTGSRNNGKKEVGGAEKISTPPTRRRRVTSLGIIYLRKAPADARYCTYLSPTGLSMPESIFPPHYYLQS